MKKNVNEYREIIERFAKHKVNQRVPNGVQAHAAVLFETMFNHASAQMRVFNGCLQEDFYGNEDMISAIQGFLSKPYASLKILVQNKPENLESHKLLSFLRELGSSDEPHGSVEIFQASGSYAAPDALHFAVMDDDAFRFETDDEKCKAIANFNEPKVAKELIEAFDGAFSIAKNSGSEPILTI